MPLPGDMLIINADDFGRSHDVNTAIVQAFRRGLCSSCSIMPNMPGFEEACELAQAHGLLDRVGLHFTLTDGRPVTDTMRRCSRFCGKDGQFLSWRGGRALWLDSHLKGVLTDEIAAQVARCRERGLRLTHLDTHGHVHEEWGIARCVMQVAHEEGIRYVRLARNFGPKSSHLKVMYRSLLNHRLRKAGLSGTDFFGTPVDYLLYWYRRQFRNIRIRPATWEVMIHPVLNGKQTLIDGWLGHPLEHIIRCLPGSEAAISYGELGRPSPEPPHSQPNAGHVDSAP